MTQFILTIEDPKDVSLAKFDGVTLKKNSCKRKTGLDEALEDVAAGRVTRYESVDEMFEKLGTEL